MQGILSTQQCTNNTILSSQQNAQEKLNIDLPSKFAKRKVTPPPPPLAYYAGVITMQGGWGVPPQTPPQP